jgi:hypothetical protein
VIQDEVQLVLGNQGPHWNMKVQGRLLERCWLVFLDAESIVEVA